MALKIGVFDSGVGGLSVIKAIRQELPGLNTVYKDDTAHLPYGTKSVQQIHSLIRPIFREFINEGCQVIVVACNTVTTNLISILRQEFAIPMVGMEPAVKPAAENTKTGVIAVCATLRTLTSQRYRWLKAQYAKNVQVLEPDCSDWAMMIEDKRVDRQIIATTIENIIDKAADQVVLGCTHYHWIEKIIRDTANGRAKVIQPEAPVIAQLKKVLEQLP